MRQPDGEAGFTLLEILVALAVLGFLVLGLAQGARFGLGAWDVQSRLTGATVDLDAVDRTLRRMVEQILPTSDSRMPTLRGTSAGFECVTELPLAAAALPSRRAVVALGVDRARRLVLRWRPYRHARQLGPAPVPEESELLRGVERLEIAYWSAAGGVWLNSWARAEPPDLLRIRLVFPRGDRRRWPDIIAAPMRERPED